MPKYGRGKPSKNTAIYRQMTQGINLCSSQTNNSIYMKLRAEGRLSRFIASVQFCSKAGLDIDATVDKLLSLFPCYLDPNVFTVDAFKDMLNSHSDVAIAWGFGPDGDAITDILIKNKAVSLIERTNSIEDIKIYNDMFRVVEPRASEERSGTVVNFNISK